MAGVLVGEGYKSYGQLTKTRGAFFFRGGEGFLALGFAWGGVGVASRGWRACIYSVLAFEIDETPADCVVPEVDGCGVVAWIVSIYAFIPILSSSRSEGGIRS